MVSNRWLEQHKPHWDRLEHLVRLSKDGLAKLNHLELQELGLLYRQTASDLSVVQEDASSAQLAAYLKQLLGRSHNLIYMGYRPKAGGIVSFYLKTYPGVFRETLPLTLVAIAIFAARGDCWMGGRNTRSGLRLSHAGSKDDGDHRAASNVD